MAEPPVYERCLLTNLHDDLGFVGIGRDRGDFEPELLIRVELPCIEGPER